MNGFFNEWVYRPFRNWVDGFIPYHVHPGLMLMVFDICLCIVFACLWYVKYRLFVIGLQEILWFWFFLILDSGIRIRSLKSIWPNTFFCHVILQKIKQVNKNKKWTKRISEGSHLEIHNIPKERHSAGRLKRRWVFVATFATFCYLRSYAQKSGCWVTNVFGSQPCPAIFFLKGRSTSSNVETSTEITVSSGQGNMGLWVFPCATY